MNPFLYKAMEFAAAAHNGQHRRASGNRRKTIPYLVHPLEVAEIAREYTATWQTVDRETMIAAAYLHDVVEDCGVTGDTLDFEFGSDVAELVMEVTDPPGVHGKAAKEAFLAKIPNLSWKACVLKSCDRISNLRGCLRDPGVFKPSSSLAYARSSIVMANAFDVRNSVSGLTDQIRLLAREIIDSVNTEA